MSLTGGRGPRFGDREGIHLKEVKKKKSLKSSNIQRKELKDQMKSRCNEVRKISHVSTESQFFI